MFRRTLAAFALCLFALAGVAAAQPPLSAADFHFHKSVFHDKEAIQAASMLFLPVPPEGWATEAEFRQARVQAAEDWMARHGYLFENTPATVGLFTDENGNDSLVITAPGIHIVILQPVGPFHPRVREQLMTATIIRQIYNGF
jgi:hypothetical protein